MRIVPNRVFIVTTAFLLGSYGLYANPNPPPPPSPPPPPGLPIDGGIIFLAVVALAFALYKIQTVLQSKASS